VRLVRERIVALAGDGSRERLDQLACHTPRITTQCRSQEAIRATILILVVEAFVRRLRGSEPSRRFSRNDVNAQTSRPACKNLIQ
jgi:hypothetical protein